MSQQVARNIVSYNLPDEDQELEVFVQMSNDVEDNQPVIILGLDEGWTVVSQNDQQISTLCDDAACVVQALGPFPIQSITRLADGVVLFDFEEPINNVYLF
jgi:hypothetical protein